MQRLLLAIAALAALPASAQAIAGGKPASDGQYPFVAHVGACTGSLVAPTWVLTAERCGFASSVTVGTVRADGTGGEVLPVTSVHTDGGVALLELGAPASVAPVHIVAPGDGTLFRPGALLAVASFGPIAPDGTAPDVLQQAAVPRATNAACGAGVDTDAALCAGDPQGTVATCPGDGGAPLLAFVPGGFRLVGSAADATGCTRQSVYARLSSGPLKTFVKGLAPAAYATEPATCSGVAGLRLKITQRRRVTLYVDGSRRLRKRGPLTLHFATLLPREGSAKVRIVISGVRTIRRIYTNCR